MGLFGAAHRRGQAGPKRPSYAYPTIIKFGTVIPYLKKIQKTYKSLVTPLSFADMSIIRQKCREKLHFNTLIVNILIFEYLNFLFLKVILINLIAILMIAEKLAALDLLKIKVF